jgi:hypothetical protein
MSAPSLLRRLLAAQPRHFTIMYCEARYREHGPVIKERERDAIEAATVNEALWLSLMEQCLRQDSPGECLDLNAQWRRLWRPPGW